jgi:hypothetical protein
MACVSCEDDDYNYIPDMKVYAFYETVDEPGLKKPDAGATVYYYCRICIDDLSGCTYQGNGKFVKDDSTIILPDEKFMIGENGSVFFIPEDKKGSATIVIESNYYKGEIKTACFSSPGNGAGFHTVFKPQ